MNIREMADAIHRAKDKYHMAFNRYPDSVFLYVSRKQYEQLVAEVRFCSQPIMHLMDYSRMHEFMGYPLFEIGNSETQHPELRISFD